MTTASGRAAPFLGVGSSVPRKCRAEGLPWWGRDPCMRHRGSCLDGSPASQAPWGALSPQRGALRETPGPTCKTLARDRLAGLTRGQWASGLLWGWGHPGTFWKSRPPCPVGFSEDNRPYASVTHGTGGPAAVIILLFPHVEGGGRFAGCPHLGGRPPGQRGAAPDCLPDAKQMASLPLEPADREPQEMLGAGPGRPGPPLQIPRHTTASYHGRCAEFPPQEGSRRAP